MKQSKVELFGHRGVGCSVVGGDSIVPENSFAAFELAFQSGIHGVELDVWLTKDNQVVVLHGGGTDLEGYLYETVVDIEFTRENYIKHKSSSVSIASTKTQSSITKPSSDSSCDESRLQALNTAMVDIEGEIRLRRIEEMNYFELKKAGLLKLREPYCAHKKKTLVSKSNKEMETIKKLDSDFEINGTINVKITPENSQNLLEDSLTVAVPIPSTLPPSLNVQVHNFQIASQESLSLKNIPRKFHQLTILELEEESINYHENQSPYFDNNNNILEVPLLREVFEKFYGRLKFNVELKGTKSKLGPMVLEIAQAYPGVLARISSFLWNYENLWGLPYLSNINQITNLLKPITTNQDGISIALLFGHYQLPSIQLILNALKLYGSEWIHVSSAFVLTDVDDITAADKLKDEFLNISEVKELLNSYPDKPSNENVSASSNALERVVTRSLIERECLALYYLTRVLQSHNHKILVFSNREDEDVSQFKLNLHCNINGLCPNNVFLALDVCRNHENNL